MVPLRDRVYQLFESRDVCDRPALFTQYSILALIVISVVAMILETMPAARGQTTNWFTYIEYITIAVFSVEYLTRVWSCVSDERYEGAVVGRLRYIRSPMAIIDLAAILPFYLAFFPVDLRFLRLFRMLRILRIARLARYSEALQVLGRVGVAKRYELGVTFLLGLILLVVASGLMYFAEHSAQPDRFTSIPATMWWSITTLTTVGYGDLYPVTAVGKLAGGLVAIIGIGMFALPTGILGAAFVEELGRKRQQVGSARCPRCGHEWEE